MAQETIAFKEKEELKSVEEYKFEKEPIKGFPELRWRGKRPFTSTFYYPAQLKENYGTDVNGWLNKIFWGDNLQVMSHLIKNFRSQVDLIYIDPPFDSEADYKKKITLRGKTISNDQLSFEEKQYSDLWSNDEYLQFMYERMILLRELLSDKGIIYIHCDWHKSHQLRCIMDEVFGPTNFVNEIVWHYYNKMQGNINRFASNHDVIISYKKKANFNYTVIREERDQIKKQQKRVWDKETQSLIQAKDADGKLIYYEDTHRTVDDVWRLPYIMPADKKQRLDYPTQKPEKLIERIILSSSMPGDLVLDCFMGSGTTQAVAMKTGRRFIGADINLGAIQITTKRLINAATDLKKQVQHELKYTGFSVYNVNHYDVFRNPIQAKDILIKALEIQPLPHNNVYDGEKDGRMVKLMPINRIATKADLNELITNFDYKAFDKANENNPGKPVESLLLVCMGHEPDLAASLQNEVPYKLDIEVVDILRDNANLEFKRAAEAEIVIEGGKLLIREFFPMNLLQKLSLQKDNVENWKELVDSVMIDFNYDGAVFEPQVVDVPEGNNLVKGVYNIPSNAGTIRVKITDLLSETLEQSVNL